jgi:hypothetical protein
MRAVLALLPVLVLARHALAESPVCVPIDERQLRCAIEKLADCEAILDYPYARSLFCPAAFRAARRMAASVAETLGATRPTRRVFSYFQTLADPADPPDDQAQTTVACLDTPAPFPGRPSRVVGAGTPLCHLVAYATSPGPVGREGGGSAGNPVPLPLRGYPSFFRKLYDPVPSHPLRQFRAGSVFDPLVEALGAAGFDGFVRDDPRFSPARLYDPRGWRIDPRYRGLSGGGGGGWGGEIGVVSPDDSVAALLAFGGGGGGGMTSLRASPHGSGAPTATTRLGAGGGGGMQLADGYRFAGRSYDGLGLGAGVGSDETEVQYSYNDYAGSGRPPLPVHEYNPAVIADYRRQLAHLHDQLRARFESGETIVLTGGGGMGAGTEYLRGDGEEYEPHALSTQAGFLFRFEFAKPSGSAGTGAAATAGVDAMQEDVYKRLGDDFRIANRRSYEDCGRDYSNYACMCPRTHATVLCLLAEQLGDPSEIPDWLRQPHCSSAAPHGAPGRSTYERLLLDAASAAGASCAETVLEYLTDRPAPASIPAG